MRKILVAAFAVFVIASFSVPASAFQGPCPPQSPFRSYDGCGPRGTLSYGHLNRGYVINGPRSVTPYAVGMPRGPIQPRVYYNPPVRSGFQSGYRFQSHMFSRTNIRSFATQSRMCHDWVMRNGVKVYTRHYAC